MNKYSIKLEEFLRNPTGALTDPKVKPRTLEELQPIIIYSINNYKGLTRLISELDRLGIEYYINPSEIEKPVRGYPINLDAITFID